MEEFRQLEQAGWTSEFDQHVINVQLPVSILQPIELQPQGYRQGHWLHRRMGACGMLHASCGTPHVAWHSLGGGEPLEPIEFEEDGRVRMSGTGGGSAERGRRTGHRNGLARAIDP